MLGRPALYLVQRLNPGGALGHVRGAAGARSRTG
jgi:hypothetical protein